MKYLISQIVVAIKNIVIVAMIVSCRSQTEPPNKDKEPHQIIFNYPVDGSVFPPEFPAPTFEWQCPKDKIDFWSIELTFSNDYSPIRVVSKGVPIPIGKSDPKAVAFSNVSPALIRNSAEFQTWTPEDALWTTIKKHSAERNVTVTITGYVKDLVVSSGKITFKTSKDTVDAPIFYRDVPLMPSESEKGVIKPLAPQAVPLIAWRLRNVGKKNSQVLMEGLHTCANCHSFSADGKTIGMDMDGPLNDKGLYAMANVQPHMQIRNSDLVEWSTFRGKLGGKLRVGFMSQVSPDSKYVITTVNDSGIEQTDYQRRKNPIDLSQNYYVANFKDYRFLQVFFPTRGILAWYSRETGHLNYLPGADDPRYVHTTAVWSPDGKFLVFARAEAKDAYPDDFPPAQYAGDPFERQIKYDLYRIPFNDGKGGLAEPIIGASKNQKSNSFPKISPDGKWIVFVQSENGMLMRPDGQLYMVPVEGGKARHMNCNTPLMNSWHSFSPNSRWMVFSSKSRSPYTQMFLTHIDSDGNDSPPILIENATAANRAVNLPEFVNIEQDGIRRIDAPAAEYAKHADLAVEHMRNRQFETAVKEWEKALVLSPDEWRAHNSLGVALMEIGQIEEAISHYRQALDLNPEYAEAYNNLGEASVKKGSADDAVKYFEKAVQLDPSYAVACANLGMMFARTGQKENAVVYMRKAAELTPDSADALRNLGHSLADIGKYTEAIVHLKISVELSKEKDALALHLLGRAYADNGKITDAVKANRKALEVAMSQQNVRLVNAVEMHLMQLLRQL